MEEVLRITLLLDEHNLQMYKMQLMLKCLLAITNGKPGDEDDDEEGWVTDIEFPIRTAWEKAAIPYLLPELHKLSYTFGIFVPSPDGKTVKTSIHVAG